MNREDTSISNDGVRSQEYSFGIQWIIFPNIDKKSVNAGLVMWEKEDIIREESYHVKSTLFTL